MDLRRALVTPLLVGLLLAGCGGGDDPADPATSSAPASAAAGEEPTGDAVESEEFGFTAPEGWRDVTDDIPGFDPVVAYAAEPERGENFATNVNVLRLDDAGEPLDDVMDAAQAELEGAGYREVEQQDPAQVDGEDAGVISGATSLNDTEYRTYQFLTLHDGGRFIVTFSFPDSTGLEEQASLSRGVMSTWAWAS